jgi:hypothetical protein
MVWASSSHKRRRMKVVGIDGGILKLILKK